MSKEWLERAYIARQVKKKNGDLALLVKDGSAASIATCPKFDPASRSLRSPITTLLHNLGVGESDGAEIYTTAVPTEMCRGMARLYGVRFVCHKHSKSDRMIRFTASHKNPVTAWAGEFKVPKTDAKTKLPAEVPSATTTFTALKPFQSFPVPDNVAGLPIANLIKYRPTRDEFFMFLTMEIARRAFGSADFHERNRDAAHFGKNIAALLVDGFGTVISWGVNTNQQEKWRHAEVNALGSYIAAGNARLPANATLYTTLDPCEMCAGMIQHVGRGTPIRVVSAMQDSTLGKTALNDKPPENIKVSRTSAKFFLNASTNSLLAQPVSVPVNLGQQFEAWKRGVGKDKRMTEYFNTSGFRFRTSVARQHWFELLWRHLHTVFYGKHTAFCDAHVGNVQKKLGWTTKKVLVPQQAKKFGDLLGQPQHEAAVSALVQMYKNLEYVLDTFDGFLRGVRNQLT